MPLAISSMRYIRLTSLVDWGMIALIGVLVLLGLIGNIDPHGRASTAFLWHSSLGITVYLLAIARVTLWLVYRPSGVAKTGLRVRQPIEMISRLAFYALVLALPLSGWFIASTEGAPKSIWGIAALPQWEHRIAGGENPIPSTPNHHEETGKASASALHLIEIHRTLVLALLIVVPFHILTLVVRPSGQTSNRLLPMIGNRDRHR